MDESQRSKVTRRHLERQAVLYVRQSTLRQVQRNTESTRRQYALRARAVALGWPEDRIRVLDEDLGKSGASSENREGFRQLVASVAVGEVGRAHSRFPGHALTPTGVMAIRCKQFHLPDL